MENPPAPSLSMDYLKFNFDKIFENLSKHKINVCIYFVYLYRLRLRWDKLIKPLHHKFNKEVKKIIQLYSKEFCVWYLSCSLVYLIYSRILVFRRIKSLLTCLKDLPWFHCWHWSSWKTRKSLKQKQLNRNCEPQHDHNDGEDLSMTRP